MELGGGTRPQFGWEEMPWWGTSVGEDVLQVDGSSASDSRVLGLGLGLGLVFL